MLYPKSNKYRNVYNLNGVWKFKTVDENYIPTEAAQEAKPMAVPASMNEIVTERAVKEHVGKILGGRSLDQLCFGGNNAHQSIADHNKYLF